MRNAAGRVCLASLLLLSALESVAADRPLVRVMTRKAESYVGELVFSDGQQVKLFDIASGNEVTIPQSQVLRLTKPVSPEDAARTLGLPALTAWQISKLPAPESKAGKIARVTPTAIYLTLKKGEVMVDQKLTVYRRKEEIRDPDTGALLAVERPRIAELKVTEVTDSYSKATLVGQLEVELAAGDEVEPPDSGERKIAVCPLYSEGGGLTDVGARLSEDLTTLLVQKDVKVVERSELAPVLGELIVQNTLLFEPKQAQKLGQLTGASHVVVGKIVPSGKLGKAYMRLVDVGTGEILYASSSSVSLANARTISGGATTPGSTPSDSPADSAPAEQASSGQREALGRSRTLPKFLVAGGPYRRAEGGSITTTDRDKPIRTKEGTFLTKDFTFELLVEMKDPMTLAFIGIGSGLPRDGRSEPMDSVNLRFHSPDFSNGDVNLALNGGVQEQLGRIDHRGTHLVRIIKEGNSVTFMVDPDADGPTDDDMETTIGDIRELAPFLNSKNMYIFFSAGTFKEVSLTTN